MFVASLGPPAPLCRMNLYSTEVAEWRKRQSGRARQGGTKGPGRKAEPPIYDGCASLSGSPHDECSCACGRPRTRPRPLLFRSSARFPRQFLKRRPKPGKWSAREHACHMAAIHPVPAARLDLILTNLVPRIVPCFLSAEEGAGSLAPGGLKGSDGAHLRRAAEAGRELKTLSVQDWERTAEHSECTCYSCVCPVLPPCVARPVPCGPPRRIASEK